MMKLNEVIVENAFTDALKYGMFKATGLGGTSAVEIAFQKQFLEKFKQQAQLALRSAKAAGGNANPTEIEKIAHNFLNQYKWSPDSDQEAKLKELAGVIAQDPSGSNINKLGNYLYFIGRQQNASRGMDRSGRRVEPTLGAAGSARQEPELNSVSQTVVKQLEKLTGPKNFDDLETIAKVAMQMLYKQNPSRYAELYKEITSGATKKAADDDDNPNIVRGYNESKSFKKKK